MGQALLERSPAQVIAILVSHIKPTLFEYSGNSVKKALRLLSILESLFRLVVIKMMTEKRRWAAIAVMSILKGPSFDANLLWSAGHPLSIDT